MFARTSCWCWHAGVSARGERSPMLCPRTRRCMAETALVAPTDSRVSRAGSAGRRGVGPVLAYLVGVRWVRVNCAVVCACVRACASLLRACVSASHCPYGGGRNGRSSCSCAPRSIPPRRVCSARSRAESLVPSRSMEVNYRCLLHTYVREYVSCTALPVSAAPPPASRARTSTS